jgi:hypothetical protein
VPVGAKLIFTGDINIVCTVLDDSNQVEYQGKAWSISALAKHLLQVKSANGFVHFRYKDEILVERRLRLEREGKKEEDQTNRIALANVMGENENNIIGLKGKPISPATWRNFKKAGTSLIIAEWVRRIEQGEKIESIAYENGIAVSTVKEYIMHRLRYFFVCLKNGIVPEVAPDV